MSGYCVEESNVIDVHDITEYGGILVPIKDALEDIWHYNRLHVINFVVDCFVLKIWYTGSIDVLSHSGILSQDWEIL